MKILYQKRDKFRYHSLLFIITNNNLNNMLYNLLKLPHYKNCDKTCLIASNKNYEFNGLFDVIIKSNKDEDFKMFLDFINETENKDVMIILNNYSSIINEFPDRKTKLAFDFVNNDVALLTIGNRRSLLKHYLPYNENFIFLKIGSKESARRKMVLKKIKDKDIDSFDKLFLIDYKVSKMNTIPINKNELEQDHKNLKSKLKRAKNLSNDILDNLDNIKPTILDKTNLSYDKYGIKKSQTKDYERINDMIKDKIKNIKKKNGQGCGCSAKKRYPF